MMFNAVECPCCNNVVVPQSLTKFTHCACGKVGIVGSEKYTQVQAAIGIFPDVFQIEAESVDSKGIPHNFTKIVR